MEQVLVNIGDRVGIRIDARITPPESRIPRPVRAGQAHGHAGLQDAIPLNDQLLVLVEPRPVQGVRHGSHQLPGRVAGQLRIGVQGDHVLHVR